MTATAHHVGAVPIDAVVCPAWCTVSQEEHLNDLLNWEGRVIHWAAAIEGPGWSVRYAAVTYANGEPDPTGPPELFISTSETTATNEALRLADAVRQAVALEVGQQ